MSNAFDPTDYEAESEKYRALASERWNQLAALKNAAAELAECLRKYQARYHGAEHAKRLWDRSQGALKTYDEGLDRNSFG